MLERRIEEAALNAWPALQQILYDGWILRFSRGYSKRANSVTPLFECRRELDEKVAFCERLYREKGLPTVFRLTLWNPSPALEPLLERRGYEVVEPSLVLRRDLHRDLPSTSAAELRQESLEEWVSLFAELSALPSERQSTLKAMLEAIAPRRLLVSLREATDPIACGMGVLEGELFGMFDLVVASPQRNRGHGAALVHAMLRWAQAHGARHAYLQVIESNAPARHLYAKLGFEEAYRYRYRVLYDRLTAEPTGALI